MEKIKIHILHCGEVCVSPYLPFGGENCNLLKAAGLTTRKRDRIWLPVSAYLIEHPKGKILVDTGWSQEISPHGTFDKMAQIHHMSAPLYCVNQGRISKGQAVNDQLSSMSMTASDLDYVLLTHLDCDHASGVKQVVGARHILVSTEEVTCASRHKIRYTSSMWRGVPLTAFEFEKTGVGPVGRSYDLFQDGSVLLIHTPGHSDGLFSVLISNTEGKYVLLFSDAGYSKKSWEQGIIPGITMNRTKTELSLAWISHMSSNEKCVESLANHDPEIIPHTILL